MLFYILTESIYLFLVEPWMLMKGVDCKQGFTYKYSKFITLFEVKQTFKTYNMCVAMM